MGCLGDFAWASSRKALPITIGICVYLQMIHVFALCLGVIERVGMVGENGCFARYNSIFQGTGRYKAVRYKARLPIIPAPHGM